LIQSASGSVISRLRWNAQLAELDNAGVSGLIGMGMLWQVLSVWYRM